VDHFKNVNDTHGHKAGDAVLKKLASIVFGGVRKSDFVARYGGEEFVAVLSGANQEAALRVANEIREKIESERFFYGDLEIPVTASFGISQAGNEDTSESVFERADKALYQAKDGGRNCCKVYEDENTSDLTLSPGKKNQASQEYKV